MATGVGERELVIVGEQQGDGRVTDRPGPAEEENSHPAILADLRPDGSVNGSGQLGILEIR
jgi:hypothetical protein